MKKTPTGRKPMKPIQYRTMGKVRGLWLFDGESLAELDKIIDNAEKEFAVIRMSIWNKEYKVYEEIWKDSLETGADEEKKRIKADIKKRTDQSITFASDNRKLAIIFASEHTLELERFSDAISKPDIKDELPIAFSYYLRLGKCELELELPHHGQSLRIAVSPRHAEISSKVFFEIHNWAEEKSQPKWQRYWADYWGLLWIVFGAFLFLSAAFTSRHGVKEEAKQLLEHGLKKEDEHRALELLLALASDYTDSHSRYIPTSIPTWWIAVFIFGLLACICMSFYPSTTLGVGKGKVFVARTKTWLSWLRFVFIGFGLISVGGSLVANVVYNFLFFTK